MENGDGHLVWSGQVLTLLRLFVLICMPIYFEFYATFYDNTSSLIKLLLSSYESDK
jgi:hypothetical protein